VTSSPLRDSPTPPRCWPPATCWSAATWTARPFRAVAEKAIHEAFGFPVDTVVLTQEALAEVVSGHPFPDPAQTAIAFCAAPIGPEARARLIALATPAEEVVFSGQVAYLRFGEGQGTSKLAAGIPRALAPLVTTVRNLATSAKLARA
jgi:uncharacterized protein (DUF1697 family)